ncbi:ABC transporter permease [Gemmatimonadota bacterium DH-20]|uniref:ABC transporter permease n=1 Tax=Gaopeijia maritima TaxID=3119007 RepID=A0ABU9E6U6_9BACT
MTRGLRAALRALLPAEDRESMVVEIEELYRNRRARTGPIRAELWALGVVGGFAMRIGSRRLVHALGRWAAEGAGATRSLRRRPGWALMVAATLGVGTGGVVTVLAVADEVLLRPVSGVADPAELVEIRLGSRESPRPTFPISQGDLEAFRELPGLAHLEARVPLEVNIAPGEGPPIRARADAVTPGWFAALGVAQVAGRLPSAGLSVEEASANLEVVVSWSLARRLSEPASSAVGRGLRVNGQDARIVGVMPQDFAGVEIPGRTDLWLPGGALPVVEPSRGADLFRSPSGVWMRMVGRLEGGATPSSVAVPANRLMVERRDAEASWAFLSLDFEIQVLPGLGLDPALRDSVGRTLALLGGAALLLLVLAAANVAGLSLTRAVSRRSRTSVQRALGAGPGRLAREVVAEHLVLGLAGGLVAVALAHTASRLLRGVSLDQSGAPLAGLSVGPDTVVVALALAVATASIAALAPSLLAALPTVARPVRGEAHSTLRLRRGLAVLQVAVSVVLLVGAGLLGRSVARLDQVDPGFDPQGILAFQLDPSRLGLDPGDAAALVEELATALGREPGVEAAGIAFPQPVWGAFFTARLQPADDPDHPGLLGAHLQVAGDLLGAMGVEVLAGRDFHPAERRGDAGAPGVVIVSADAVEALFPGRDPRSVVGSRVVVPGEEDALEIVGVVPALRRRGPRTDSPPSFIRPWGQSRFNEVASGWVRARPGALSDLAATVNEVAARTAPDLPLFDLRSVEAQFDRLVADTRVVTGLALATSVLGLVLAALGLYGVLAWSVAARTREIGVRVALGSATDALVRRFVAQGLGLAALGLLPGVAGAIVFARLLESRLFGVGTLDPVAWSGGLALLLAVAAAASWIPARRAASVDVGRSLAAD